MFLRRPALFVHLNCIRAFLAAACLLVLAIPLTAATATPTSAEVSLTSGRVLILGDSITQDGRYVTFIEYYLKSLPGGQNTDLISIGLSSETVSGLSESKHPFPRPCVLERVERALTLVKPQVVVACYGMNDGIYHPSSPERLAAFNHGVQTLISRVRAAGARLVLVTPPVFDPVPIRARTVPATAPEFGYGKPYADYDRVLGEFAAAECALAGPDVVVIDLHAAIGRALSEQRKSDPSFSFTPDGVHPGDVGHLLIAQTLLSALGENIPVAKLADELTRIKADPRFALVAERRELRSEAWLPYVGYQRGEAFKSASVAAAEKVALRLQREIDDAPSK